jgi:hypothetical protein
MATKPPKAGAVKPPVVSVAPVAAAAAPAAAPAAEVQAHAPDVVLTERGRYLVGSTPILRDGVRFECASVIELTASQAERLRLMPAPAA